jgi:ABC-type sugar transport system ATPase subunit
MAQIRVEGLRKEFGKAVAVNDLSLTVEDGEFLVLLGPSGCGKTTTMNCIAGLETPSRGAIYFNGEDVTRLPPHHRNTAMVFQSALLYPHLTGRQNIAMSLKKDRLPRHEVDARIEDLVNLLNIRPLLDKLPAHMSGGERQRVATAKALVRQPTAFLLDEPLSALDAAHRESLRTELVNIQTRLSTTTIFVTHDQIEAMTMGDRIAVMKAGDLQQIGTPKDVYDSPDNLFVAGFVGSPSMNFLQGSLVTRDDGVEFRGEQASIPLPSLQPRQVRAVHGGVVLGVRPQHVTISHDGTDPGHLRGQIFALEHLGREIVASVDYGGVDKFKVITSTEFRGRVGEPVSLTVDDRQAFLFDADGGRLDRKP